MDGKSNLFFENGSYCSGCHSGFDPESGKRLTALDSRLREK